MKAEHLINEIQLLRFENEELRKLIDRYATILANFLEEKTNAFNRMEDFKRNGKGDYIYQLERAIINNQGDI